jgi:putative endopeptidase
MKKGWTCLGLAFLLSSGVYAEPGKSGLDLQNLDPQTPPHQDFFQYANGGWLKANPIPEDKPRWGTFNQLLENNQEKLHNILLGLQATDENARKLRDFFSTGMDPAALNAGLALVKADYQAMGKLPNLGAVQDWTQKLHARGTRAYFVFGSGQDYKDSSQVTGQLNQGGLGMPDRDYYFRKDDKSDRLRAQYLQLIGDSFSKIGDPPALAKRKAQQVYNLEKRLADASLTLVEQRNPEATYHPTPINKLPAGWNWPAYFKALGTPPMTNVNVGMPKFFARLAQELQKTPLEHHRAYLQWHLLRGSADYLGEDWSELHYGFYGKALTGAPAIPPRWRRVVKVIDRDMGDALGEKYVEKHFPPAAKAKVEDMVTRIRAALSVTLNGLAWMSPETKQAAQTKLAAFHAKIGYPERRRDYRALQIDRSSYLANVRRAMSFEVRRDLHKIGKPPDKNEWYMSPPTVNAYYDPQNNEIVFPAGILQPPFFSMEADDAVNYGALGTVIGHEITHGFDDQGAQFDARGNLRNWWTSEDLKKFQALAEAIEQQFSGYQVADGLNINGKLVVGESIADLGGLKLALMAYRDSQKDKAPEVLDGFTPEQRFFLGYARIWAMNMRPEYERLQVNTDPHPHPRFRVNGPLSNLEEFQRSFGVPADSPMVRKQRNRVW